MPRAKGGFYDLVDAQRKRIIEEALRSQGSQVEAARVLRLHRNSLRRWIKIVGVYVPPHMQEHSKGPTHAAAIKAGRERSKRLTQLCNE